MIGREWIVTLSGEVVGTVTETYRGYQAVDTNGMIFPCRDFLTVAALFDLEGDDWS